MKKKYRLTKEKIIKFGRTLYRIKAIDAFMSNGGLVIGGTLGGYVESYTNLSQEGTCWIFDDSVAMENAVISGDAIVNGSSIISGNAQIKDKSIVKDSSVIDNAVVSENAYLHFSTISDHAVIKGRAQVVKSKISGNASVLFSSQVNNSIVSGNSTVTDSATVGRNSEINGNACISNNAMVVESRVINNVLIKNQATVEESHISNNVIIKDKAKVFKSTISNKAIICRNMDVQKCIINVTNPFNTNTNVLSCASITDCDIKDILCVTVPPFFSISKIRDSITLRFNPVVRYLIEYQTHLFFSSFDELCDFLTKTFPIKKEKFFTKKENMIAVFTSEIFHSYEVQHIAASYAMSFFENLRENIASNKKNILDKKKKYLLDMLTTYFFFKFVNLYLIIAISTNEQKTFFSNNEETINLFIDSCNIDIENKSISSFGIDFTYDDYILYEIANACDFSRAVIINVKNKFKGIDHFNFNLNESFNSEYVRKF